MTIANWSTYFDLLQDKYGAPYFTDAWKSLFFNRAIVDFVNSHFPESNLNGKDSVNIEQNQDVQKNLGGLIYRLHPVTMSTTGLVSKASLAATASAAGATTGIMRILGVTLWNSVDVTGGINSVNSTGVPVKFVRHNDIGQFLVNVFKKPTLLQPRWTETASNYEFMPVSTTTPLTVTILRYPATVDIGTSAQCDLPDFTHNEIIARALQLAGVSSRDEALAQLLTLQSQQK